MKADCRLFLATALAALFLGHPTPSFAVTRTVTNLNDSGPGSLRDTIAAANNGDIINFAVTGTISFSSEIVFSKSLTIGGPGTTSLILQPAAGQNTRLFRITGGTTTISDLTIANGRDAPGAGIHKTSGNLTINTCIFSNNRTISGLPGSPDGGAIYSGSGNLTLNNSTFADNSARNIGSGGAIFSVDGNTTATGCTFSGNSALNGGAVGKRHSAADATLSVTRCVFLSNSTPIAGAQEGTGGAISCTSVPGSSGAMFTVESSVFGNNTAVGGHGGAISVGAIGAQLTASIRNSTFSGNQAAEGGAVRQFANNSLTAPDTGTTALLNCTFTSNLAGGGGGAIANKAGGDSTAMMQVTSCTLSANGSVTGNGSGLRNYFINSGTATLFLANTILQKASGPGAVNLLNDGGTITSQGYNLADDNGAGFLTGPGDQINTNPKLDPAGLQDNGGPTQTIALLSTSTAIDRGHNLGVVTDQRGMLRPVDLPGYPNLNNGTDIGAYEATDPIQDGSAGFLVNASADRDDGTCGRFDCTLREAINRSNQLAGADTIQISFGGTITLNETLGPLTVTGPTAITGPGARTLGISGGNSTPVFNFSGGPSVLSGLTIRNGRASAVLPTPVSGAGLFNNGTLTVNNCAFLNNTAASGFGANLCEAGGMAQGAGLFNGSGGSLVLNGCTFAGNTLTGGQGRECFSDFNTGGPGGAAQGAAIFNEGGATLTLSNCTLTNNSATGGAGGNNTGGFGVGGAGGNGEGAGVYNRGTLNVRASTIAQNTGTGGAGGLGSTTPRNGAPGASRGGVTQNSGSATARNSIVALNTGATAPDVAGAFTSEGYNFIGIGNTATGFNATGDQVGSSAAPINPNLGLLQNNGGPTDTRLPAANSPVLDKGNSFGLTIDQRGLPRPFDDPAIPNATGGDGSDIGAVEISPFVLLSAVSRKAHGGAGDFDVLLPGVECRTGGGEGTHMIIFTFTHPLASVGNVSVTGSAAVGVSSGFGSDPRQYVVTLGNVPNAQQLVITLSNISDQVGGNLASASTSVGILLGDTNGDRAVSASDVSQTKAQSGQTANSSNFRSDVNISGAISAADISQVKAKSGTTLP